MLGGGDGLRLQELPRVQCGAYGCDADEEVKNASPPAPFAVSRVARRTDFHWIVKWRCGESRGFWSRYLFAMRQAAAGGGDAQDRKNFFFMDLKVKLYQQISSGNDLPKGMETTQEM